MDEILKSIRVDLRRSMNGDVSKNMRDKGLDYKINFGIDVIRLRTLAKRHQPNAELAELLWKQQPRELKIMATLLYPPSEFSIKNAHKWIREIPTHEIREHLCMNLLQNLDYADNLVANWILSENEELRISGFWLVSRLVISKSACVDILDYSLVIDSAIKELHSEEYFMRIASKNALKFLGRVSQDIANEILGKIKYLSESEVEADNEIYDSLHFEFESL